ncbi:SDR family oxidoreductase [Archangium lipolyticum]|uniref:SDR family oxidoreductase n=1 Tax=Archangium lipolyticum TaxID=2970465 RepID=UPI00214A166A|nr:SDR family oxidoreductase [Archangium lipolyticum]
MQQQSILITGSSTGFGRLAAETLARKGHIVFAGMRGIHRRNESAARELNELARRENLRLHVLELDVTDDASVRTAVDRVLETAGRVDAAVNNAGMMATGLDEGFTDDQLQALFDTNVFGVQRVIRAVLPHMRERRSGLLLTVSSNMARITFPFLGIYCASKRAVEGLAESYRYQLAPLGIDSVIVEPGGYPTALFTKIVTPEDTARVDSYGPLAELPQKMFGGLAASLRGPDAPNPQEVADVIARLIETPVGSRPLRTIVDHHLGDALKTLNEVSANVHEQLLTAHGMGELLSPAGSLPPVATTVDV